MNRTNKFRSFMTVTACSVILNLVSCSADSPTDLTNECIIPKPVSVTATGEAFTIKKGTDIYIQGDNIELKKTGDYLAAILRPVTGFEIDVITSADLPPKGSIILTLSGAGGENSREGYKLDISKKTITISASAPAGVFMGIQTIRQLLPASVEKGLKMEGPLKIATGTITDNPVYSYRGAMLDVSRHFFGVEDVKRFIDFLAVYKMNVLHLHLSDDQGWRIEIKSWPNLTTHGGSLEVGGGEGGFYTQEQYTEIVNYAKDRFITIVPEIDMPGHTNAALSSYAELNIGGKATELYTGTKVGFSTLNTKSEITYKFIDDVIRELAALTPGEYIHIGGDESHSTKKEDYITFMNRVQDIAVSHGKKVLAWDEIALSTIKPGTIAQVWASEENAKLAVSQGAKILMAPAKKAYLDMQYDKTTKLGLHWAAYIEVDAGYNWDPEKYIPGIGQEHIIGIEAPLWSETVTNMEDIEYMVFPRLPGYAEIGWTPSAARNWEEYKIRLAKHGERFDAMGINYYRSKLVPWPEALK